MGKGGVRNGESSNWRIDGRRIPLLDKKEDIATPTNVEGGGVITVGRWREHLADSLKVRELQTSQEG